MRQTPSQGDGVGEEDPTSSGCAAPPGGTASVGLGMLALMAGPSGIRRTAIPEAPPDPQTLTTGVRMLAPTAVLASAFVD